MLPEQSLSPEDQQSLLQAAKEAAAFAYAPYSSFKVGAALLTLEGRLITGANVENASYGLTLCAERVALVKAISEGERAFQALAVWGASCPQGAITPCGACRQMLVEFFQPNTLIIMASNQPDTPRSLTMGELLPEAFLLFHRDNSEPHDPEQPV